jgi:hypothetical protein
MISLPPGARVWLACGRTDMRNYAEYIIMRSDARSRGATLRLRHDLIGIPLQAALHN